MSLDNEQSKVIQGRFHLTRKLGAGSFGEIFEAKDLKTGKLYACKAESLRTKHPQLRLEYQIYRALQNSNSFVRVWGYVTHYNHQIMIMDKLGDSLEQLFTLCGRKFSIRCVCAIAIQILTRIEELHKHNYLHRDIKPDNFLIGHCINNDLTSKEAGKVYMIDLGLGKVWKEGGRHIPEKHGKRLIGTPRYASINTHFGHEQSRRDDLESLGYMLMYFAHGQLPWQGLRGQTKEEKYQKIGHKKRDTRLTELCAGYPDEFRQYLSATQKLSFQQDPPYETYRSWFRNVLKRHTNHSPFDFDWQNRNNHHHNHHSHSHHHTKSKKIKTKTQQIQKQQQHITQQQKQQQQQQQHITQQQQQQNNTNKVMRQYNHHTNHHHTNNNNNNPLTLPNLQANPNNITNNITNNIGMTLNQNQNTGIKNQFNNFVDRYQRCRNLLTQQQQTNHQTNNHQTNHNTHINNNRNNNNNLSNRNHNHNHNHNHNNNNRIQQQQQQQPITKSFATEYQELVSSYKKLESQSIEYKRMLQASETNYKKLKQKCNGYISQLNDSQQTIAKLTYELNAYRQQAINNQHQPPAHKRRKLNNGMQRRQTNNRL